PDGLLLGDCEPGSFLGKRVYTDDGLVNLAPRQMIESMEKLEAEWQWEKDNCDSLKLINMRGFLTHNSFMQNAPSLVEGKNNTNYVYMNPLDAENAGLSAADGEALVYNENGAIRIPLIITSELSPGSAAIPFGWGHQRADGLAVASCTGGANVNFLTPSGEKHVERLSLMAHLSGILIKVCPVPEKTPLCILTEGEWDQSIEFHLTNMAVEWGRLFLLAKHHKQMESWHLPAIPDYDKNVSTPINGLISAARLFEKRFIVINGKNPPISHGMVELLEKYSERDDNHRPVLFGTDDRFFPFPGSYHSSLGQYFEKIFDSKKFESVDLGGIMRDLHPILISPEELTVEDRAILDLN
ncbi:MAG: hypothetical protein JEY91_19720, partial [Spirochaetaceae bacterium]|nr:hypothetical protein [Spirochaetaceae bacterium]